MAMRFLELYQHYDFDQQTKALELVTHEQVERVMGQGKAKTMADLGALLSPAAGQYLEQMANLSSALTEKRFGKTIRMFAPMYLSNECQNICTYCGFSFDNKIARKTLTQSEIIQEALAVKEMGFDHLLLVTGEANRIVGMDYFLESIQTLKPYFSTLSMEVQPLEEAQYTRLHEAGIYAILLYQETYDPKAYAVYHTKGKKANMEYRLEAPDRIGASGMHKIGIGALFGLADWRTDAWYVGLHLDYLRRKYPYCSFSISFPRIRPASGVESSTQFMGERELLQAICAFRLFDQDVELSLSTREREAFRDGVIGLGVTTMSAASKTEPGGYSVESGALEQFSIDDERSVEEVCAMIEKKGYQPVWKDWIPEWQAL